MRNASAIARTVVICVSVSVFIAASGFRAEAADASYVFVTAETHTGDFENDASCPGLSALQCADQFCNNNKSSLPGTYTALLSTTTINAKNRIYNNSSGYKDSNGNLVSSTYAALWTTTWGGGLAAPIQYAADGSVPATSNVFTGSTFEGVVETGFTCNDWTTTASGVTGRSGDRTHKDRGWLWWGTTACSDALRIYCFQNDPTVVELSSFSAHPSKDRVLLEWRTGSETDNAGFHIQRSQSGAHGFERINEDLIPAKGGPTEGAEYDYEDLEVTAGSTYRYRLEDVSADGVSTYHGPVKVTVGEINLVAPRDGDAVPAASKPKFSWETVPTDLPSKMRLVLQFASDRGFAEKVLQIMVPKGQSGSEASWGFTPTRPQWRRIVKLLEGGGDTVFWRVQVKGGQGFFLTSEVESFRIEK